LINPRSAEFVGGKAPSAYLQIFPDHSPDHRLLYSTRRSSLVRVTRETARAVMAGRVPTAHRKLFQRLEMIVEDPEAERRAMLGYFDRLNGRSTTLELIVVVTMACNFACPYCFEGGLKGARHLSRETADRLVDFVSKRLTPKFTELTVTFYGGEPLLAPGMIRHLSKRLRTLADSRGVSWEFGLMTNGSLLTPALVKDLIPLGLTQAQVTLDGPPRLHDRTRPFTDGTGSFHTILDNLKAVHDRIRITLTGNYGPDTWREFIPLLDRLPAEGIAPEHIAAVRFTPIMKQPDTVRTPGACSTGCDTLNAPWTRKAAVALRQAILDRGFSTPKPGPLHCMAEIDHSLAVDWDGALYKCPAFIGRPAFAAGDLCTGIRSAAPYTPGVWKNPDCLACPYLPQCFGGCRYMAHLRHGRTDWPDCMREWFDAVLPEMVKQDSRCKVQVPGKIV